MKTKLFSNLVVSKLFSEGISGLLKKVVETSFAVANESFYLLPLLLPPVTVTNHVVELLEPCLDTILSAVPLAAYPLHLKQLRIEKKKKKKTSLKYGRGQ